MLRQSLDLQSLSAAYKSGSLHPEKLVCQIHEQVAAQSSKAVWISHASLDELLDRVKALLAARAAGTDLPLYGVPFAVKDNIDVAGVPTTAACPEYEYTPAESAAVIERLLKAGAIYVGKTNLDQFATGLVGTRSPYGPCPNAFDPRYVSGGSSAGSAVAVATGLVSFALGTDTAGSGRVPAAFNNLVGLKPTRGLISTRGVVPACRSLDCVSIFALTSADARAVLQVAAGLDVRDPYSRPAQNGTHWDGNAPFVFGVPRAAQLQFFGDHQAHRLYDQALGRLAALGGSAVEIDYEPFREAAALLYEGPWVAERLSSMQAFLKQHPAAVHAAVREILQKGERFSAVDAFIAQDRLQQLRRMCEHELHKVDVLALPTAPTIHTIAAVLAEPIKRNTELGYYTNFVNLLDLCALALPAGIRPDGLPFGITLVAPAFSEYALCYFGNRYQRILGGRLGATAHAVTTADDAALAPTTETTHLAVVGAHLTGQPLNYQLTQRNARLLKTCRTASSYRLYALRGTVPPKPGLIYEPQGDGNGVEVEVWEMPTRHFGSFVAAIPPPLGVGTLTLDSGEQVKGFICEPYAIADATDITHHGGWRAYLKSAVTA